MVEPVLTIFHFEYVQGCDWSSRFFLIKNGITCTFVVYQLFAESKVR